MILGDILDKNKENLCLCSFIRDQGNIFLLKGNHEYLCERYLEGRVSAQTWQACGGKYTIQEVNDLTEEARKRLHNYLKQLPIYISLEVKDKEYFLTHSGFHADYCIKNEKGLVDIQASVNMAINADQESYLFSDDIHYIPASLKFDKKLIVGHHPTILLPDYTSANIYYGKSYIDIDTGNDRRGDGGRMACLRLDDGEEFYI